MLSKKASLVQGALIAYLAPRMARNARVDLSPLLVGVTAANLRARAPGIAVALRGQVRGKLAQDADIEDVTKLISALADFADDDDDETEEEQRDRIDRRRVGGLNGTPEPADEDPESEEEREHRMEARDRRARHARDAKRRLGRDENPDEVARREEGERAEDRRAWDARVRQRGARDEPPPFPGRPRPGGAIDHLALDAFAKRYPNIARVTVDASGGLPMPARRSAPSSSAAARSFAERFPNASAVRVM
jgi:hypothetical protein